MGESLSKINLILVRAQTSHSTLFMASMTCGCPLFSFQPFLMLQMQDMIYCMEIIEFVFSEEVLLSQWGNVWFQGMFCGHLQDLVGVTRKVNVT